MYKILHTDCRVIKKKFEIPLEYQVKATKKRYGSYRVLQKPFRTHGNHPTRLWLLFLSDLLSFSLGAPSSLLRHPQTPFLRGTLEDKTCSKKPLRTLRFCLMVGYKSVRMRTCWKKSDPPPGTAFVTFSNPRVSSPATPPRRH